MHGSDTCPNCVSDDEDGDQAAGPCSLVPFVPVSAR